MSENLEDSLIWLVAGQAKPFKERVPRAEPIRMAPKLFTRHPKGAEDQDAPSEGTGEAEEFFSNQLRLRERPPVDGTPLEAPMVPLAKPPDPVNPGWYPDTAQPGRMLYWDGFHFTGQSMQVESKMTERPGSPPANPPAPVVDPGVGLAAGLAQFGQSAPQPASAPVAAAPAPAPAEATAPADLGILPTFGQNQVVQAQVVQSAATEPTVVDPVPQGATPSETEEVEMTVQEASVAPVARSEVASGHSDEADTWAEETERAVSRAREAGTPEAWQEAAHVAAVVSEIAQTLQAKAEATKAAEEVAGAAREAERQAKLAADASTEADRKVERAIQVAERAVAEAKAAELAAAEAKRSAEQAAHASPKLAEAAKVAARTAADAERKAEGVEQIVSKARSTNTPEAWREARKLAAMAMAMQTREDTVERAVTDVPTV